MKLVSIVGDKFSLFAQKCGAVCASDLEQRIRGGDASLDALQFELGLGVGAGQVQTLLELAALAGRRQLLRFDAPVPCGARHVHKERPENALIELPFRTGEREFRASVCLDHDCELLSDHVTGSHVPGMVLIEAVRQMTLAVTEEFYAERFPRGVAFLWSALDIRFVTYAFPIKTSVEYVVLEEVVKRGNLAFVDAKVRLLQRDSVVVSARMSVDLRDRVATERREATLALAAAAQ